MICLKIQILLFVKAVLLVLLSREIDPSKLNKYYQENYGSVAKRDKHLNIIEYFEKNFKDV